MKYIFIILLFLFISCNGQKNNTDTIKNSEEKQSPTTIDGQNRLEKELHYIKQRNSNVDYFKNKEINDKIGHQMNDSILALEKLLKNILSTTRIPNLTKNGQINLQTFYPEMGFGMLDGLWVEKEETMLLCISDYIFYDFFPEYKFENLSPSQLENIFSAAFAAGHVITSIHSYKIDTLENNQAYGMISIDGQDIGPFKPNTLYALTTIENNIYLISKSINQELKGLEKCTAIWNNVDSASEDEAWKNYCKCYHKEFEQHEQAQQLKREIDKMLALIVK